MDLNIPTQPLPALHPDPAGASAFSSAQQAHKDRAHQLLAIARMQVDRGDLLSALPSLEEGSSLLLQTKDFPAYLRSLQLLLRVYAELLRFDDISRMKESLQDLVLQQGLALTSRTFYTLAVCANARGQFDVAQDYIHRSLQIALETQDKEDLAYAIFANMMNLRSQDRFEEALAEVDKLEIILEINRVPDLLVTTLLMKGYMLARAKRFENALDALWSAYDLSRETKKFTNHLALLLAFGKTFLAQGEKETAKIYLDLALRATDPSNFVATHRAILECQSELNGSEASDYDLILDPASKIVVERNLGKVDFRNQFVLLDLLRVFAAQPGQVHSKEQLVEEVWKQKYDPAVHDNKVYVTIKRLRKLIEPEMDRPRYIFRAKNGYYLSRTARVLTQKRDS